MFSNYLGMRIQEIMSVTFIMTNERFILAPYYFRHGGTICNFMLKLDFKDELKNIV